MDNIYRSLMEEGWKITEIDDADIYDLLRLLAEEKKEIVDEEDKSAFNFLP